MILDNISTGQPVDRLAVSRGWHGENARLVYKFAHNFGIAATSIEDVWDGPYPFYQYPPDAGAAVEVVSGSPQDSASGTGAQVVRFSCLSPAGVEFDVDVQMNGTTPVALPDPVWRVWRASVISAQPAGNDGATPDGGRNAGQIELRASGGGPVYAMITAGENQTWMSQYTVPAGYSAYLASRSFSTLQNNDDLEGRIYTRERAAGSVFRPLDVVGVDRGAAPNENLVSRKVPEMTDIVARVLNNDGGQALVLVTYDLLLLKNKE